MTDRPVELVNLSEASRRLSVPVATLRSWTRGPKQRLWPRGLDHNDVKLYDLDKLREIASSTRRRTRRADA